MSNKSPIIQRGDLFIADLNPTVGSEQSGVRPVLVIQNNIGNVHSPMVIVAPITSANKKNNPLHVPVRNCGLMYSSIILAEQIRAIDKSRLIKFIGYLDDSVMEEINTALGISIGLNGEYKENHINDITEMCLCNICARKIYESPDYTVMRKRQTSAEKENCICCGKRRGFPFIVLSKQGE